MRRCNRCRSSLIADFSTDFAEPHFIWKCLGCGRETFVDAARQAEDDQLREEIAAVDPTRPASLAASQER
jgi:hypothetical protein